jgi:hypothetical protein
MKVVVLPFCVVSLLRVPGRTTRHRGIRKRIDGTTAIFIKNFELLMMKNVWSKHVA